MYVPKERSPVKVLLLSLITCGIYYLYWVYVTSEDLDRALGETDIPPIVHLLLFIVTGSLWGFAWDIMVAREVDKLRARAGLPPQDSNLILWLVLDILGAGPVAGLGIIVTLLQQTALNDTYRALRGRAYGTRF